MSGVSLPVTRPVGRALVVANPASRPEPMTALQDLGFTCDELDDPYAAMAELCRRPLAYRALILSLASVYREELTVIDAVKRRFPHLDVWVAHTDGRQAALADAIRLGADGLLADDGLHRVALAATAAPAPVPVAPSPVRNIPVPVSPAGSAMGTATPAATPEATAPPTAPAEASSRESGEADVAELAAGEPVLTADELRALLQEQPTVPPVGGEGQ